ncbi:MAG: transposase [Planctomycetota bacterium]
MGGHRRSIRIPWHNYALPYGYFITICANGGACVFGHITHGKMILNDWGVIVQKEWNKTACLRNDVRLDSSVIMPNHFHATMMLGWVQDRAPCAAPLHGREKSRGPIPRSLGTIVCSFKAAVTRRARECGWPKNQPIWQRNYYEHIIRSEDDLNRIREYVSLNPLRWNEDCYYTPDFSV